MLFNPATRSPSAGALAATDQEEPSSALGAALWTVSRVGAWAGNAQERRAAAHGVILATLSHDSLCDGPPGRAPSQAHAETYGAECSAQAFWADGSNVAANPSLAERARKIAGCGQWGGSLAGAVDAWGPSPARLSPPLALRSLAKKAETLPEQNLLRQRAQAILNLQQTSRSKDIIMRMESSAASATLGLSAAGWGAPSPWGAGQSKEIIAPWKSREQDGSWISAPAKSRAPAPQSPLGQPSLSQEGYLGRLAAARGRPAEASSQASARRARGLGGNGMA